MRTVLLLLLITLTVRIEAMPAQVILIRHAEKINDEDPNLSPQGYKRAKALVPYFTKEAKFLQFGMPVAIYAMKPKDKSGSRRAIQTVQPLAESLKITINQKYKKKKIAALVNELRTNPHYNGKSVLISWQHDYLPKIAHELGVTKAPDKWRGSVYNQVWVLEFPKLSEPTFSMILQNPDLDLPTKATSVEP